MTSALRLVVSLLFAGLFYGYPPFAMTRMVAAGSGVLLAVAVIAAGEALRRVGSREVIGGASGALAGIVCAALVGTMISRTVVMRNGAGEENAAAMMYGTLFTLTYLGIAAGVACARRWSVEKVRAENAPVSASGSAAAAADAVKLLDTSVLIDGRLAEICEANFLDGALAVPQFVLRELQMVADSSDSLKRQRGRRGLEVLQRMQKMAGINLQVLDDEIPETAEVDQKLVELARRTGGKIVTNDFNLNKVASVQGITVLNVNLLANAVRPAVLPGESMRVLIMREGKEQNQGVAYLGDGTMVVVDGARRVIGKNVDVIVTSVHQTPAGKMIFARLDERGEHPVAAIRQATHATQAASVRGNGGPERMAMGAERTGATNAPPMATPMAAPVATEGSDRAD